MAGDLDFNVQLRVLNDQFNNGINQARDKFTQYAQSVQRNVNQMSADTERASTMIAGLNNVSADRLTAEIRTTADQLRQMGAGASLSGEQVEAAMQASAQQVIRLARQLEVARSEAERLNSTPATPAQIEQAAAKVNTLADSVAAARAKVELLSQTNGTPAQITEAKVKVETLTVSLAEARAEVKTLSQTNASPEDIAEAKAKVAALKNELGEARTEAKALGQTHASPADIAEAKAAAKRLGDELGEARIAAERLSQTGASPQEIAEATASINRLEQELNNARSASVSLANELAGAMNRASNTTDNARNALYRMANIRVPETIRGEIDSISRALVDFQNNSGRPASEIERATRAAEAQIRRLENELNGLDDTQDRVSQGSNNLGNNINKLQGAFGGLQGLLAAAGLGVGIAEIIEMSDAFVTLEAKVKLATGEGSAFVTGFQGVTDIAKATFTSVESTGELFSRITQASETLGLAQSELLGVTKTINQAIQLSGGSAASADAAIIQLVQGLQSGVVRGEEFNSIMEQAPRLATAMADGLGVTKGELRAMAAEGKLTSEVVIEAVRSQTKTISDEFATLPNTFGNAVQNMKTTVFELVGSLNESVNQSGRLAEAVNYISKAIDNIDPATMGAIEQAFDLILQTVGSLFTSVKDVYGAFSELTSIIDGTVAAGNDVGLITKLMQNFAVVTGVAVDGIRGLSIVADSVFGTISGVIGSVLIGIAKINGETSTMGEALIAKQEELHARSEQKMMEFKSQSGAAWAEMNKTAQDRLDETVVEVVKNYDEMVAKGSYAAEAMEEQYIKVARAKITANDMVISDDMRLELAGKELQASISETGDLIVESSKGVQAAYLGVGESFAEVALKAQESGTSMRDSLTDAVPKAQTIGAVDDIISSLSALGSQGKISGEDMAFGINLANERYKDIEANFARYAAKSIAENGGIVTSELEKAAALQGLAVQATETGSVLVTQLDRSTVASTRTKEQIDELAGAVGIGLSKEFIKSSASLDELVSGFDDLEKAGYDAGGALTNALTDMTNKAKNTAELEYVIEKWNELGKEGKLTGRELADGLDLSRTKLDELTDGINSVAEAYGVLGLKTREELAKQAGAYTEAYGIIKKDGQATAQQLDEAFEKTAKSNIASNNGVVDAVTKRMAAERGVTVAVDEQGRVTFEKMGQAKAANDNVTRSVNNIRTAYDGISSSAGGAGNAMVRAANDASSAYDKLQAKIKAVKEAQAVADERTTMQNLRIYGKEEAPAIGDQFGTRLGVENFLKSQGLSEAQAIEEARKLYAKQGTSSGKLNFGELQGFSEGQIMTTGDLDKFKSATVYLAEIAEKARQTDRQRDNYEAARTATAQITTQEYGRFDSQPRSTKTIDVNLRFNGASVPAQVAENQENALMALLKQLGESRAIAGQ